MPVPSVGFDGILEGEIFLAAARSSRVRIKQLRCLATARGCKDVSQQPFRLVLRVPEPVQLKPTGWRPAHDDGDVLFSGAPHRAKSRLWLLNSLAEDFGWLRDVAQRRRVQRVHRLSLVRRTCYHGCITEVILRINELVALLWVVGPLEPADWIDQIEPQSLRHVRRSVQELAGDAQKVASEG